MLRHKVRIDHPLSIEEMDAAIVARRADMLAIDTNVVVRLLVDDDHEQYVRANNS